MNYENCDKIGRTEQYFDFFEKDWDQYVFEKHECERSPRDRGAKKLKALLNGCLRGIIFAFLVTKVYFSFGGQYTSNVEPSESTLCRSAPSHRQPKRTTVWMKALDVRHSMQYPMQSFLILLTSFTLLNLIQYSYIFHAC